ncbi:uncharacterized protein BDV17DRAFT_254613, partial [Aspergillus undulatus]|uniref:uncharacterized protein n=1 Tax=Aspergillus undulatus TaxID=1810928 RepID=UPI003CCDD68A
MGSLPRLRGFRVRFGSSWTSWRDTRERQHRSGRSIEETRRDEMRECGSKSL